MPGLAGTTRPRAVTLRTGDLQAQLDFYRDILGLSLRRQDADGVTLVVDGGGLAVRLEDAPGATPRPHPSLGLYHNAFLVPDRRGLAEVVQRLDEAGVEFEGFADHGVSEAAYVRDPEGNGVEVYRDRPRGDWPRDDDGVQMLTRRLDVGELLVEADGPGPLAPGTTLGHVHLHVADLETAERFWADGLGLDVTQRSYPGALFLSAGGYHHHVGCNTWAGDRRAPKDATGLVRITWEVPPGTVPDRAASLRQAGFDVDVRADRLSVRDPTGIEVVLADGEKV